MTTPPPVAVVPVEPNDAMIKAAGRVQTFQHGDEGWNETEYLKPDQAREAWAAMLAAAPPAQAGGEVGEIAKDIVVRFLIDAQDTQHVSTETIYKGGLIEKITVALESLSARLRTVEGEAEARIVADINKRIGDLAARDPGEGAWGNTALLNQARALRDLRNAIASGAHRPGAGEGR